jgi:hypothetical protein
MSFNVNSLLNEDLKQFEIVSLLVSAAASSTFGNVYIHACICNNILACRCFMCGAAITRLIRIYPYLQ